MDKRTFAFLYVLVLALCVVALAQIEVKSIQWVLVFSLFVCLVVVGAFLLLGAGITLGERMQTKNPKDLGLGFIALGVGFFFLGMGFGGFLFLLAGLELYLRAKNVPPGRKNAVLALVFVVFLAFFVYGLLQPQSSTQALDVDVAMEATEEAISEGSAAPCMGLGDYRDYCLAHVAIATLNDSLCEEVGEFRDYCYEGLAFAVLNPALCDEVVDAQWRISCVSSIVQATGDYSLCYNLSGGAYQCFSAAVHKRKDRVSCGLMGDRSMCELVGCGEFMDMCYVWFSAYARNDSACFDVVDSSLRDVCFHVYSGNPALCGNLSDPWSQNSCYNVLAFTSDSPGLYRGEEETLSGWYLVHARFTGDSSSCGFFEDEIYRSNCYNRVAAMLKARDTFRRGEALLFYEGPF